MVNFVVLGEHRSGSWPITSLLNTQNGLTCHSQAVNHREARDRMLAHYGYFGAEDVRRPYGMCGMSPMALHPHANPDDDDHWIELNPVLHNYIEKTLFPNPISGETHIGVRLTFETLRNTQLADSIHRWCRTKDVAIIFVDRNPFDCYVSYYTGERYGKWIGHTKRPLLPVSIDPALCSEFVHASLATRDHTLRTIQQATEDYCLIQYRWLLNLNELQAILANYLRLPVDGFGAIPMASLHPYPIKSRVANYTEVRKKASSTVREMMDISEHEDNLFFS